MPKRRESMIQYKNKKEALTYGKKEKGKTPIFIGREIESQTIHLKDGKKRILAYEKKT
jgi:hypothetical protein